MKKLVLIFVLILSLFSFEISFSATWTNDNSSCSYDPEKEDLSITEQLDFCLDWSPMVDSWMWSLDVSEDTLFWNQIKTWVNNISVYLLVFAVWAIVFWGLMMTLSTWDDEKINKAKNIIKWGVLWFLALILASAIINLVVKIMYSL